MFANETCDKIDWCKTGSEFNLFSTIIYLKNFYKLLIEKKKTQSAIKQPKNMSFNNLFLCNFL